jgi:hypothetical protein
MKKSVLFFFAAVVAAILVIYAVNIFPIPGTDSIVFIPPALLYSKGFGLANPLYYVTKFTDLTHTGRFNYYVPFYPFLLGILSKISPGIKTIFIACSLFSAANILLYTQFIASRIPKDIGGTVRAIILMSITYVATYLLPTVGRPEGITILMVFLVYMLYINRSKRSAAFYNMSLCILFALMLATQIICFYFCFLFFITFELINSKDLSKTIVANVLRGTTILVLFCLVLAVSPNGLVNTIDGIRLHISYVLTRSDRSIALFFHYWLLAPLNFGFLIIFLLAAFFYVKDIMAALKRIARPQAALVALLQLFTVYGIIKFILYASPTVYNATQFILPISAYLLLHIFSLVKAQQKTVSTLAFVTYLSGTIVFLRTFALFVDYMNDGKVYDTAKTEMSQVAQKYPGLYVTQGLWPLFEDPYQVKVYDKDHYKPGDIVVIQQAYHPFPPELVNKCTVLYDWSTAEKRKIFGLSLTNRPQGYSFVVCRVN